MPITKRYEHDHWERNEGDAIVHLKRSNSRVQAIELDLDSLWESGFPSFSFLKSTRWHALQRNTRQMYQPYTHTSTPSSNRNYFHNAVFFGVVGSHSQGLLTAIRSANSVIKLVFPKTLFLDRLASVADIVGKFGLGVSPDFIDISDCAPVFHIEDS